MFGHKNVSGDGLQGYIVQSSDACPEGERRLIVGKGLSLSGEITFCDSLSVSGKVEATLLGARTLEISESGQYRGRVEVERADIAGRFDGQLTVHGRLTVRSTGRVSGVLKYGELEVATGGHIVGELQTASATPQNTPLSSLTSKPSFKFPSLTNSENGSSIFRKDSSA